MRKELNFGNIDKVSHIFHIADIHIRLLNRHTEYREVFNNLYNEIKSSDKNTIVFIGGDIVHNKIDVTSELTNLVYEFLFNVVSLRPVVLIKGNHDLNVNNQSRVSILDVVVPMINNPQLNYIDDSENIYYHNNLDFILYSFMNEEVPTVINQLNKDSIKIGMFHGALNGSKTDTGMTLESNTHIKRFKDVDILLLGDIHKYQVISNSEPIAVYPGSLIQQDFGETLNHHGYILWDLPTLKHAHYELDSKYGYYNYYLDTDTWTNEITRIEDINSGHINDLSLIKKDNIYLKIKYIESQKAIINDSKKLIIKQIKESGKNLIEASYENISETKLSEITNRIDIHSIKSQLDLLLDYFKVNNLDFTGIEDVHNEILTNINYVRKQTNIWNPIELKFSNLFSYGEDNHINFKNMKGSYGLFAPNTFGKSSIMEIVSFVCFNRTSKSNSINKIMNVGTDDFNVKFTFENNNNYFKIVRSGERKKDKIKMLFNFYKVNEAGDIIEDLTESKNDSYTQIKNYIGTYEDFVLTTLSLQNNNSNFIDKTQSQRKELIQQFLELDIFDKLYQSSNQKVNEYKTSLKTLTTKYDNDNDSDYKQLIINTKKDLGIKELELITIDNEIELLENEINDTNSKIKDIENFNINEINNKRETLEFNITKLENKLKLNLESLDILLINRKEKENQLLIDIDYNLIDTQLSKYKENLNSIDKIRNKITQFNNHLQLHSNLTFSENCDSCFNNMEHFKIEESNNKINELNSNITEIKEFNTQILNTSFNGYSYEEYVIVINNNKKIELELKEINSQITINKSQLQTLETELESNTYKLNIVLDELNKYNESIILFKQNSENIDKVNELKLKLNVLKQNKQNINKIINTSQSNIIRYETILENLNKLKSEIEDIQKKYTKYNLYNNAVSKNGIVLSLFRDVIPVLENEANLILGNVCKFKVNFELDGNDIDCYIDYGNDNKWDVSTISGMEKFITSLAIRIALINISQLPRSNFMCIDEGFGVLDKENMSELQILFSYFKNIFNFYVIISHIEVLRDFVDNTLNIERDVNTQYSKISYK